MRFTYQTPQWLPYPVPRVFAFFANPANLPRLMPAWQRARIDTIALIPARDAPLGNEATVAAAGTGTRLTLSFRPVPLSPIRLSWQAEIQDFVWHQRFCDVQLHGPFAYWRHCHSVRREPREGIDGTLLTDHVVYEMPLGLLGHVAHTIAARRQIESIFNFRHQRAAELLAAIRRDL